MWIDIFIFIILSFLGKQCILPLYIQSNASKDLDDSKVYDLIQLWRNPGWGLKRVSSCNVGILKKVLQTANKCPMGQYQPKAWCLETTKSRWASCQWEILHSWKQDVFKLSAASVISTKSPSTLSLTSYEKNKKTPTYRIPPQLLNHFMGTLITVLTCYQNDSYY